MAPPTSSTGNNGKGMNMVGRLLRALAALIVLVAVVVGAPIALWVLGRGLLPTGVPSLGEVWEGLTSRDTGGVFLLSLIHISEPTRRTPISYAVFCLKKKNKPHKI